MRLLIHDLKEEDLKEILPSTIDDLKIISDDNTFNNCIGCFGCWVKTPGACVIRDAYGDMGQWMAKCEEVIIISKCFYGGFSPFIKKVIDRSISYVLPYFEIRNGEMHHKKRYQSEFNLKVWFYGDNITEEEKQTAEKLIKANAVNLSCRSEQARFLKNVFDLKNEI